MQQWLGVFSGAVLAQGGAAHALGHAEHVQHVAAWNDGQRSGTEHKQDQTGGAGVGTGISTIAAQFPKQNELKLHSLFSLDI
jgi:hypothetical protein